MKELKLATVLVRGSTDTTEWSLADPKRKTASSPYQHQPLFFSGFTRAAPTVSNKIGQSEALTYFDEDRGASL